jgi:hypothetical protein
METHEVIKVRDGRRIVRYEYRGVWILRIDGLLVHCKNGYATRVTENVESQTLRQACAKIDKWLDTKGRTFGGKLVVAYVRDGQLESALANPDWRHPHARLVSEIAEVGQ